MLKQMQGMPRSEASHIADFKPPENRRRRNRRLIVKHKRIISSLAPDDHADAAHADGAPWQPASAHDVDTAAESIAGTCRKYVARRWAGIVAAHFADSAGTMAAQI